MNGKGSKQRPRSPYCTDKELQERWDKLFRKSTDEPDINQTNKKDGPDVKEENK